jgi:FixJ family two-component response regulator
MLLTDSVMPDMKGSDLLTELRAEGFTGPAVLMTGYEEEPGGPPPGFAATLEKPFGATPLAQVVRQVLDEAAGKRKAS